jgi:Phosphoglycerate dehydrogenase and related dehydrogenases
VTVTNAGGIHAPGIAEQVLGAMLSFSRGLLRGRDQQRRGTWQHYQPGELQGSTVTVVGMGSIGSAVVKRLQGFEVDTVAVRHTPAKGGPTDEVLGYDHLHEALSRTDYLVLACPLTDVTTGLLGPAEFATLPPSAVVVNVARGAVLDTDALVAALRTESIRGAAVDVTDPEPLPADHPLWDIDDCLVTPHVGGHTPHHWERLASLLADNVAALDGNGPLRNVVSP